MIEGTHPSPFLIHLVMKLCREVQRFASEARVHDLRLLPRAEKAKQQRAQLPCTQRPSSKISTVPPAEMKTPAPSPSSSAHVTPLESPASSGGWGLWLW